MPEESQQSIKLYPYRWVILAVAFTVSASLYYGTYTVPGMSVMLMTDYGFSPVEFSIIATMPYLSGFVFCIPSGVWADRRGIRQVVVIGMVLALCGTVLRCISTSFIVLLIGSFLMGFALAALNANSAKLIGMWFSGRNTSAAMGLYVSGANVGVAVALFTGPFFKVAETGFLVSAVIVLITTVIWFIFGKNHPCGESQAAEEPIMTHLQTVIKSKNAWVLSLFMFFLFGSSITRQTFVNSAFAELSGSAITAGVVSSYSTMVIAISCIVLPMFVARMKNLKPIMIIVGFLNAFLIGSVLLFGFGVQTWILMGIQSSCIGVLLPSGKTLPTLMPDLETKHLGAVGGLQAMFQNMGAWLVPAYVVVPICTAAFGGSSISIFVASGIFSVFCALTMAFLPETGTSIAAKQEREAARKQQETQAPAD